MSNYVRTKNGIVNTDTEEYNLAKARSKVIAERKEEKKRLDDVIQRIIILEAKTLEQEQRIIQLEEELFK